MSILPEICPSCKKPLKWTKSKKDLFCANVKCTGSDVRKLTHFFTVLTTDGITETTCKNMMKAGLTTIPQILSANKAQISKIEGFADKKIANMLLHLKKLVQDISLPKLMHASGIFTDTSFGIGETLLTPIVDKFGHKEILQGKIDPLKMKLKIISLPNMGAKRAEMFVEKLPSFRQFYSTLNNVTLADNSGGKLSGQVYCFTGFRDAELQTKLEKNGGRVSNNMSRNVTVLFAAAPSDKTETADKYSIRVVMKQNVDKYMKEVGL